jgi:WD40 repeat protein
MPIAYLFDGVRFLALDWPARPALRWVAWRPDGGIALTVGNGGATSLFDGRSLERLSTNTRQNLRGAAWSPDGAMALVVGNRGAVLTLEGESIEQRPVETTENLRRVAWHPSGDYALIIGNGGTVLRFDRAQAVLVPLPGDRAHTLRSIAFRPDGAYALVGAYSSRWAGYPRPHAVYRCDGRYLQALLASDDEDDLVAVDWSPGARALVSGYGWRPDGSVINKMLLYDGSTWQTRTWPSKGVVLGGSWRPGTAEAILVGEGGLVLRIDEGGAFEGLDSGIKDNLIGPFWRPDGSMALILKGPGNRVYTV